MDWLTGSQDGVFVRGLLRASELSDKQSARLFRLWGATKEQREQRIE